VLVPTTTKYRSELLDNLLIAIISILQLKKTGLSGLFFYLQA